MRELPDDRNATALRGFDCECSLKASARVELKRAFAVESAIEASEPKSSRIGPTKHDPHQIIPAIEYDQPLFTTLDLAKTITA